MEENNIAAKNEGKDRRSLVVGIAGTLETRTPVVLAKNSEKY